MTQKWQTYEQVAAYLLDKFAADFGLSRVEGKQKVRGQQSGTDWEIDAKGVREDNQGFIIVECRRYTTSKLSQEDFGALAYRIIDTGAEGALSSPLSASKKAPKKSPPPRMSWKFALTPIAPPTTLPCSS